MQHWASVLPVAITECRYETLVADPEKSVRRLVEAAHLPWSDSCLRFHESDRAARTASYAEIRKPIHAENLEKWRPYESFIGPLKQALAEVGLAADRS
jgi:hypothetical protein